MTESAVSLSASFRTAFDNRVAHAAADVGKAERLISSFEEQLKGGQPVATRSVEDARRLANQLNMTGSAFALEGLNGNISDDDVQTQITKVERAAERLTVTLARLG